ncbi:hypothetical protein PQC39_gp035 [Vibrio phage Vp_R1]|uniref:Uncharacterized protein n=1 Tax=Vibrio phage Vp_R1 TaxID=2059867 RepID=A0A2H5BPZ1_9CAUD|nr:hypothetical protein PQC39_gp035 [Vibrio phage Vp_R1]AUG88399.1 hypothetical protein VPR_035 [Vibrio phage Vp_R1]
MSNMKSLEKTMEWFSEAIPTPTLKTACVQIGCHIEEVAEMFEALGTEHVAKSLHDIAMNYKTCDVHAMENVLTLDREGMLDSVIDQTVTAAGISHMLKFDHLGALGEINGSNFSKFLDGKALFDENGKIKKGPNYYRPNLEPFVGKITYDYS